MIYEKFEDEYRAVEYYGPKAPIEKVVEYRSKVSDVTEAFKKALYEKYASFLSEEASSPIWNMAWEHGHSYGFSEVENYYSDFSEMVEKVLEAPFK